MKTRIKSFFGANRQYVVSGASSNPSKFGFKILLWYISHDLTVIPVNPKEEEILGQPVVHAIKDIVEAAVAKGKAGAYDLDTVDGISISFLTPPGVTATTLKQIATVKGFRDVVKGVWLQPGSYDQEVLDVADKIGLGDKVIEEDECILKRGDEGLYSANL